MKLYGNLQNRIFENVPSVEPEIGMGVTGVSYSDRDPYTVIEIKAKNRILVQEDSFVNVGEPYSQDWLISPDTNGRIIELIKTKNGWKEIGGNIKFVIGVREKYYDYGF